MNMKTGKRTDKILQILIVAVILITLFFAGGMVRELYIRSQSQTYYQEVSGQAEAVIAEAADEQGQIPEGETDWSPIWESVENSVAWIRCSGTNINFPVVQGSDNDYYLTHLPNGTVNKAGSIFMDYLNNSDFTDDNTIIYGHNMRSGDMFAPLGNYKQQTYYEEHPVIELQTPQGGYEIQLFAGYIMEDAKEELTINFESSREFTQYLAQIRERSTFDADVAIAWGDRLVTLCTCTYELDNSRYILVGKLTEL